MENETFQIIFKHYKKGQSREIGKYQVHESIWIFSGKNTKLPETVIESKTQIDKKSIIFKLNVQLTHER